MKPAIRIGVSGALGRMGGRILDLAAQDKGLRAVLALERSDHPQLGADVAGVKSASDVGLVKDVDVLIDFSSVEATLAHLVSCVKFRKPIVIGTTGFSDAQKKDIKRAAAKIAVVFSPNMSIGVNLLFELAREAAARLPKEYQARIVEAHHIHKKDAPSGTAKFLGDIIKAERGIADLDIKSIREGEIIGDHDVIFESPWDTLTLTHHAKTRDIFALGALEAAKFTAGKKKGLFGMADVLKKIRR